MGRLMAVQAVAVSLAVVLACLLVPLAMAETVSPTSAPAATAESAIAGTWTYENDETRIESTYSPDGTYTCRIIPVAGQPRTVSGKYRLAGDKLEVLIDGKDQPALYICKLPDTDTLDLADAKGNTSRMTRRRAAVGGENKAIAPDLAKLGKSPTGHILFTRYEMIQVEALSVKEKLPIPKVFIMNGDGESQAPFIYPPSWFEARNPQWTPDGGAVLFASNFEIARSVLFTDIFRADLKTGVSTRVTGNEQSAGPVRGFGQIHGIIEDDTPGGRTRSQLFVSFQGGGGKAVHPDGWSTLKDNPDKGCWGFKLDKVPAGKVWVKVWVSRHLGSWKLVDVPANGVGTVEMNICDGNNLATNPSITPDGRYVVGLWQHPYYVPDTTPLTDGDGAQLTVPNREQGFDTIAVFDAAKGGLPVASWDPIKMRGLSAKDPRVSPDGKWIAFAVGLPSYESIGVCSLESMLKGAPDVKVVVPGERVLAVGGVANTNPNWSADSKRITFLRATHNNRGFTGGICVVNADGTGLKQVAQVAANQCPASPSFSPDGKRIAFQLMTSKKQTFDMMDLLTVNFTCDVWSIDADGANAKQLTRDGRSCEPSWGP